MSSVHHGAKLKSWFVGLVILSGLTAEGRAGGASAVGQFLSGHQVLEWCTDATSSAQDVCLAYVAGVFDQLTMPDNSVRDLANLCIPPSTDIGQLKDVFIEFMRKYPQVQQFSAAMAMDNAWSRAYPC